ncbi:hypothetical protein PybrP1_003381 [[Pythium] brassicae (nom. inval.)]|nr:hypothetical protein PybrP1_003381 [[Pythium] brassicae (nom. inval.)]
MWFTQSWPSGCEEEEAEDGGPHPPPLPPSHDEVEDVDDALAALAYAHEADEIPHEPIVTHEPPPPTTTMPTPHRLKKRKKRKNFSKQLQLLTLQHYALFSQDRGRLPDKSECQRLLHESYAQFLQDGGAPEEPRLSPAEFLKLIRNRRCEMHARVGRSGASSSSNSGDSADGASGQPRAASKRKLQQEHVKIYELIEIIDQARARSGRVADTPTFRQPGALPETLGGAKPPGTRASRAADELSPVGTQQQLPQLHRHESSSPPPPALQKPMDPQDQILAIFRVQQETLEVQQEIAQRLKVIRLHRSLQQHDDAMEPSSASV